MNSSSDSQSYFGYEQYGGTWHDAEKDLSNPEDDLLCWAAAASNVLAWTGWGTPPSGQNFEDEHAIFQYFQSNFDSKIRSLMNTILLVFLSGERREYVRSNGNMYSGNCLGSFYFFLHQTP